MILEYIADILTFEFCAELEHEQLVKGVNKCKLEKKEILLVEHLIGTEKIRDTFKRLYDW